MIDYASWCKELSDATESLEEEGLLLALLCVECCAPSPRGSVEVRLRCLERLEDYRRLFARRGVALRTMCGCGRKVLLLLYRPAQLEEALRAPLAASLLEKDGYRPGEDLEAMLDRLGLRLRTEGDFPHEIGLFLGYPPEDVAGFQRHRGRNC